MAGIHAIWHLILHMKFLLWGRGKRYQKRGGQESAKHSLLPIPIFCVKIESHFIWLKFGISLENRRCVQMHEKRLLLWKDAGTVTGVLEEPMTHAGACPPSQSRPQRGLRCRTGKNRKYLIILEGLLYTFNSVKLAWKKKVGRSSKGVIFSW